MKTGFDFAYDPNEADNTECIACGKSGGNLVPRRICPIRPGWPKGWGEPPPQYKNFHKSCYPIWHDFVYWHLAEIDQSVNEAADYVREGRYDGYLIYEGEKYPCKSWWTGNEFEYFYPQLAGKDWWRPRRPEKLEITEDELKALYAKALEQ